MSKLKSGTRVCECGAVNSDMHFNRECKECAVDLQLSIRRAKLEGIVSLERELKRVAEHLGVVVLK
jgi:hypothetical protein